jgi:hypothetical protein
MQCTYSTPCGWCVKWDKKCDKKIGNNYIISETSPKMNDDNSPGFSCDKCVHFTELSSFCSNCHPIFKYFKAKENDQ